MTLPKAELHVHLEGTLSPELALKLAKRNQLDFCSNSIAPNGQQYACRDFLHFLSVYDEVASCIKHPRDYYDITFDYLKNCAQEGAIYIEMMYSPEHAERSSGIPSREHLAAIQEAINHAEQQYSILGRIIITAVRHFGVQAAEKVATQALKENASCIVGFGLAGEEVRFPPKLFQKAFAIASAGGLPCTVHAGEFAPAEKIMEALDYLPVKRIGHGVMSYCSPQTIARLIDEDISLEVCPSSNIALHVFPTFESHPLPALRKAGIKVSINTDDPPFFATNIGKEYQKVQEIYQYSEEEMRQFTRMAIDAAFVDLNTKKQLQKRLISE